MKNTQLNKTLTFKTGKDILNLLEAKEIHASNSTFSPPATETESALYTIWKTVLGHDRFGVNDDFFRIGGNSLKAVQLISRLSLQFSVNINLTDVFLQPTITQLAAHILTSQKNSLSYSIIEIKERPEHIPLSFSQERLWFIDQLEGSVQYHLSYVLRLKGNLHQDAIDYALQTFVNRHEILRTVIRSHNGVGYQFIKDKNTWQLSQIKGSQYVDNPFELKQFIAELIRKPFDLTQDHLLRATLIKLTEEESIFVATLHHIASDGWSKSIFVKELVPLYNNYRAGKMEDLPTLNIQYADYSIWQRNHYQGEWFSNKLSYWKKKLEGISPLELPTDYLRQPVQSTRGAKFDFTIEEELLSALQQLSEQQGVTLFMTLLSVFKVLLHRYSNQEDISIGTPIANRTLKEVEELIGFFVNTLVLRSEVNSNLKFIEFLQQVKTTALEAYEQQDLPFEKVVEAVVKDRDPGRNPLFQVMFILQNVPPISNLGLTDVQVSREVYESNTSQFDLTFIIRESNNGLNAAVEYCTDLFSEQTIVRMIGHYKELLNSIVKQPNQKIGLLPMLTAEEEHQLLIEFNDTKTNYPKNKTIADLFEEQAAKTPEAIGVVFEEEKLTYKELNGRANQLAHYLKSKGIKEETLVPICIERSLNMIVGILGILKAGGSYVPIDPEYPEERISYMLEDTGALIVVSSKESKIKLQTSQGVEVIELDTDWSGIKTQSTKNLQNDIQLRHLAYVIYTSGSTGKPKGVMIEHGNVYSFLDWCKKEFSHSSFEIVYAGTSICFDLSIFEIFYPLSIGKCVRVIENGLCMGKYLPGDRNVLTNSVPSVIQTLLNDGTDFRNISVMNMAGEPIPLQVQKKLDADNIEIRNLYGPTEDTTYSTVYRLKKEEPATIGRPISNTQIYIVNKEMELVPVGLTGEICIGGAGLARGYLNRAELTREKFITNPFSTLAGARLYKTGDLGRWLPDGNIDYLGRLDNQVKIRGYRIELGEIESVLLQCAGVAQAVVLAKPVTTNEKRLVAYIIPNGKFNKEAIVTELKSKLPDYMVPVTLMELQSFPLTTNGKIDRKAFPEADAGDLLNHVYVAPRNKIEEKLAGIWIELLGVERISVYDDFFQLGGHSLLAMRVVSAIQKELEVELKIKDLFEYTTISDLSNYIEMEYDFAKGFDSTFFEELKV